MNLLGPNELGNLRNYIESNYNAGNLPEGRPMSFMVEVIPGSMSTDVKVSVIDDPDNYIKTRGVTSIIDWDNYDF
jgi:hypothetical protein